MHRRAEQIGEDQRIVELKGALKVDMMAMRFSRHMSKQGKGQVAGSPAAAAAIAAATADAAAGAAEGARVEGAARSARSHDIQPNPEAMKQFLAQSGCDAARATPRHHRAATTAPPLPPRRLRPAAARKTAPPRRAPALPSRDRREPHDRSADHAVLEVQLERLMLSHSEVLSTVQSLSKGQEELRAQLFQYLSGKEQGS